MNVNETKDLSIARIDASCRVPLLALLGGAAAWLVAGLGLSLIASIKFHAPGFLAGCPLLTFGRVQPAANDAILYGFAIPAALGVMLWVFARLSRVELVLPLVPFVAANIWHLGVLIGTVAILAGHSTGFLWLEYPRFASPLLLAAFLLIAVSAVATFGQREERELYPSHWFLLAALLWFPWIYSTANLFLVAWPVRGVAQAVIDWWFTNNLVFVWLALVGLGLAFYFLPKLGGRPLQSRFYAQFAFWTLMLFGTWLGIPQGAPVPAWLPAISTCASALLIVPLIAIAVIFVGTVSGVNVACKGGPFCYVKFGSVAFIISGLILMATGCPELSRVTGFTWFEVAQVQWQIFGFFAIVVLGGVYELFPRVMGFDLPFPKFVRFQHWLFMGGAFLLLVSLGAAGVEQGLNNYSLAAALPALRISTLGLLLLLLGSLLFAANIFVMTFKWKLALLKSVVGAVKSPLETAEVKS
ncbi:MAG: cbb3-type cytochrome c oxidase subunit I [Verrucomicrobiota bacterium]|jgi:cytochrome c oxidase cbb3-type subunit 1